MATGSESSIFCKAIGFDDTAARLVWLNEACGSDANLQERMERRLEAEKPSGLSDSGGAVDESIYETIASAGPKTCDHALDDPAFTETRHRLKDFLSPPTRPGFIGRIGHYEIEKTLGVGAFGIVVKAFDDRLKRIVAIKFMNPDLAATSPPRKRFLREARIAASVRHDNIVAIHAVEELPIPWLVMEYVPGCTLQKQMDQVGPLDVSDVVGICRQVAAGLAAAHSAHLIHRDIKPSNILLEGALRRHAKISDFGLARTIDDASQSASGMIAGTPLYMSPEQARGERLDPRSDLFSLGSVMYQMISGRPPFRASTAVAVMKRVCEDKPRGLQEIQVETPRWLVQIVERLLSKDPDDRFQSAAEVADLLEKCEVELGYRNDPATLNGLVANVPRVVPHNVTGRSLQRALLVLFTVVISMIALAAFAPALTSKLEWWEENAAITSQKGPIAHSVSNSGSGQVGFRVEHPDAELATYVIGDNQYRLDDLKEMIELPAGNHRVEMRVNGNTLASASFSVKEGKRTVVELTDTNLKIALRVLSLGGGLVARIGNEVIDVRSKAELPTKRFSIKSLGGENFADDDLREIGNLRDIEGILIRSAGITDAGIRHLANNTSLRSVQFFSTSITDAAARHFATFSGIDQLTLQESPLVTDNALPPLAALEQLRQLNLSATSVTGTGLRHFAGHKNLRGLILWRNPLTDDGMRAIGGLKQLEYLELGESATVGDSGMTMLSGMNLKRLCLRGTGVSDASIDVIASLKDLTWLDIRSTDITPGGAGRIRQLLPGCQVLAGDG